MYPLSPSSNIDLTTNDRYLNVVRRLIQIYTLEPAGSHGVWGLDDHFFMSYIFGSAQLTRPITEEEAMPLEGSVERAPKPGDVLKADTVERLREINMYFSAIGFINDVKKGPFWEHSPILYDISGIRDGWGKINKVSIRQRKTEKQCLYRWKLSNQLAGHDQNVQRRSSFEVSRCTALSIRIPFFLGY